MIRWRRPAARQIHLQTARRLRALRIRLTVFLLVLNVVGLVGMGGVALIVDQQQRSQLVTAELRRTASTAVALLHYDSGTLRLDNLFSDPTGQGATAVYVYEGGRRALDLVFAHPAGQLVIPPATLADPAAEVYRTGEQITATVDDTRGNKVHMLAVPFRHPVTGAVAGTVVVVADPRPGELAHSRLAITLVLGGAVFMLLAGVGGNVLARRGTRPAAEALDQQERFVADAAHELRTPLTVIRALCEAALAQPSANQPATNQPATNQPATNQLTAGQPATNELATNQAAAGQPAVTRPAPVDPRAYALREVLRSTQRLSDSVDALLTRARLVAGLRGLERQRFRLDQLAEEVLAETVQPPHTVELSTAATVADGDPTLIRIAIRNLGHNAVRHGRLGDEPATIKLIVAANTVVVEDRGPGPGSRPADPDRQRFRTDTADGVGLGLAIAHWVAQLHGGTLRLDPAPGGGTAVTLTLPEPPVSRPSGRPER